MNKHLVNIIKQYTEYKYVYILYYKYYEHKQSEILGIFKANSLKDINNEALQKILYERVAKNCEMYGIKNYEIDRIELYENDGEISVIISRENDDRKYFDNFVLERHVIL